MSRPAEDNRLSRNIRKYPALTAAQNATNERAADAYCARLDRRNAEIRAALRAGA